MATALVNAGLTTFQKIADKHPRELELVSFVVVKDPWDSIIALMSLDCKPSSAFRQPGMKRPLLIDFAHADRLDNGCRFEILLHLCLNTN